MTTNLERARAFYAAFDAQDMDAILGAVTEDVFYHNIPMEPMIGKAAMDQFLRPFCTQMASEVNWVIHAIAESADGKVLAERTDRFRIARTWVEVPVSGTLEFTADGLISHWRDYFDLAGFQAQMASASAGGDRGNGGG